MFYLPPYMLHAFRSELQSLCFYPRSRHPSLEPSPSTPRFDQYPPSHPLLRLQTPHPFRLPQSWSYGERKKRERISDKIRRAYPPYTVRKNSLNRSQSLNQLRSRNFSYRLKISALNQSSRFLSTAFLLIPLSFVWPTDSVFHTPPSSLTLTAASLLPNMHLTFQHNLTEEVRLYTCTVILTAVFHSFS